MLTPIEIKASEGITSSFFDGLKAWNTLAEESKTVRMSGKNSFLIYAGNKAQEREGGVVVPWKACAQFVEKLFFIRSAGTTVY